MKNKKFKKKYRTKKRKPILENNIIAGFFVFVSFLLFFIYFVVFCSKFQLKEVIIENDQYINKEVLTEFIISKVDKEILFFNSQSIIIVNENSIKEELLEKIPIVRDVEIKRSFPDIMILKIKERIPASIWCEKREKSSCYYIDKDGVAFQRAESIGKNFFIAIKKKSDFIIGDTVLNKEDLEKIIIIKNNLKHHNFNVHYFHLHSKDKIEVVLDRGWSVFFTYKDTERELKNFSLLYSQTEECKSNNLKYIELRYGDRLFCK